MFFIVATIKTKGTISCLVLRKWRRKISCRVWGIWDERYFHYSRYNNEHPVSSASTSTYQPLYCCLFQRPTLSISNRNRRRHRLLLAPLFKVCRFRISSPALCSSCLPPHLMTSSKLLMTFTLLPFRHTHTHTVCIDQSGSLSSEVPQNIFVKF
jgi:hypothetical protein